MKHDAGEDASGAEADPEQVLFRETFPFACGEGELESLCRKQWGSRRIK